MQGLQCFRYPWRHSGDLEFKKSLNLTHPKPPQAPPLPHFFFLVHQSEVEVTALLADVCVCESERWWQGVCSDSLCESMGTLHFKDRQRAPRETAAGQNFCQWGGDMEWFTKKKTEWKALSVFLHTCKTEGEAFFRESEEFSFCPD